MSITIFELFKIGIGPSSSHTVGPMRAARCFAIHLKTTGHLNQTSRIKAELFGSLGATGKGHGSDKAVLLGLSGEEPDRVEIGQIEAWLTQIRSTGTLHLLGEHGISFCESSDLILHKRKNLPYHPNGMRFSAIGEKDTLLESRVYYSVGGGFILDEHEIENNKLPQASVAVPYPFTTGNELLSLCKDTGYSISKLMMENEKSWQSEHLVREKLLKIWQVMQECVERGCHTEGVLPGGMKVKRRAAGLYRTLTA